MFARTLLSVSYRHSACLSQINLPVYRSRKVIYRHATPSHASKRCAVCLEHIGWLCYCCCYYYYCVIIFVVAGSQSYVSHACVYPGGREEWVLTTGVWREQGGAKAKFWKHWFVLNIDFILFNASSYMHFRTLYSCFTSSNRGNLEFPISGGGKVSYIIVHNSRLIAWNAEYNHCDL
jgi:hypothetical protein